MYDRGKQEENESDRKKNESEEKWDNDYFF